MSSESSSASAISVKKNATTAMGYFWKAREMLTPTLKKTAFLEKGVLTPDEFVRAGDELVSRCPTWSWCGSNNGSRSDPGSTPANSSSSGQKAYLPADKQYLITRNVPCRDRVATLEHQMGFALAGNGGDGAGGGDDDDGDGDWMVPTTNANMAAASSIEDEFDVLDENGEVLCQPRPSDVEVEQQNANSNSSNKGSCEDDDEYADMEDFVDDNVLMDDDDVVAKPAATTAASSYDDNIVKVRTYDLSITYDKYYQTPRIWMSGKTDSGDPLTAKQTMEDVMTDYANKTVTMEAHPHIFGIPHASIHPCQHGKVMKTIVRNLMAASSSSSGDGVDAAEGPSVEMYLFIFLKFVSSIIPTINYDFTMDVTADTSKK